MGRWNSNTKKEPKKLQLSCDPCEFKTDNPWKLQRHMKTSTHISKVSGRTGGGAEPGSTSDTKLVMTKNENIRLSEDGLEPPPDGLEQPSEGLESPPTERLESPPEELEQPPEGLEPNSTDPTPGAKQLFSTSLNGNSEINVFVSSTCSPETNPTVSPSPPAGKLGRTAMVSPRTATKRKSAISASAKVHNWVSELGRKQSCKI